MFVTTGELELQSTFHRLSMGGALSQKMDPPPPPSNYFEVFGLPSPSSIEVFGPLK